jgi:hypothetical protein
MAAREIAGTKPAEMPEGPFDACGALISTPSACAILFGCTPVATEARWPCFGDNEPCDGAHYVYFPQKI